MLVHVVPHQLDRLHDRDAAAAIDVAHALLERESAFATARGASVTMELVRGEPFDCLVAASRDAELLVIGTHKTGFIQGHAIGSRFLELATMSFCPVAYIPNVPLTSRRGVVVAVDGSATGRRAAALAAHEAARLDQDLIVLESGPDRPFLPRRASEAGSNAPRTVTRAARRGLARELIDASQVAALVVVPHPEARLSVGSPAGAIVHDVILNLAGPAIVVPRSDADGAARP
jgi:nucleotide-binding universal stress UspA family protein